MANAEAADADKSRKLSAGVAHSIVGYGYIKQDKTAAAIPELKSAALLRGRTISNTRSRYTGWGLLMRSSTKLMRRAMF